MMLRRELRITRAYDGRDPMVPGAVWIVRGDVLPHLDLTTSEQQALLLLEMEIEQPEAQYNQHVMDYWAHRLDRLTMRTIGRK